MLNCITIYGGTFDPVHLGHSNTAVALDKTLHFDEIRFLPCKQPVLKAAANATPHQRLAMLELALAECPKAVIDEREIRREGPSYMVDTLASLREEMPSASLCLIIGMDAFNDLPRWHRWQALFDFAHIIVINRPGITFCASPILEKAISTRETQSIEDLKTKLCGLLYFQELPETAVSSTLIRQRLRQGEPVASMLDARVLEYIQGQHIYR